MTSGPPRTTAPAQGAAVTFLNKVPVITATFWLIKILSTTIGETFADYLAVQVGLGPALTDGVMMSVLAVTLVAQLRARRFIPWLYWLTVVLVSIVGTQITDFFTDTLGVPLVASTAVFAAVLAVVFTVWWRQERTLAITAIDTPRRERYYWGAILTTFALGTAGGDYATEALSLGFRTGVLIFGGLILAVWAGRRSGLLASVPAFWVAYVLTRPLGASLGDLLTQSKAYGGVGLGASLTSLVFLAVIVALVAREQRVVDRHGVQVKGQPRVTRVAHDYAWAVGGAAAVAIAATVLTPHPVTASSVARPSSTPSAPSTPTAGGSAAGPATPPTVGSVPTSSKAAPSLPTIETDATSPLGDLRPFAVVVDDVSARVARGDLSGGRDRVKDLEVAWDDAEAGLKPASPDDWHTLDDAIDGVLTSLRADSPTQAACAGALMTLSTAIATVDRAS